MLNATVLYTVFTNLDPTVHYGTVGMLLYVCEMIIIWELSEDGSKTWTKHVANSNNSAIRKSRTKSWGCVIFTISIL